MIQRNNVASIIIEDYHHKRFVVYGRHSFGRSQQRSYKDYSRALKYSLQLKDYYQAEIIEVIK